MRKVIPLPPGSKWQQESRIPIEVSVHIANQMSGCSGQQQKMKGANIMKISKTNNFPNNTTTTAAASFGDSNSTVDLQQEEIILLRKKLKKAKRKEKQLKDELKRVTSMSGHANASSSSCYESDPQIPVSSRFKRFLKKGITHLINSTVSLVIDLVVSNLKRRFQKNWGLSMNNA